MLRRIYDWTLRLAEHPYAMWILFAVSFAESSIFPIPPDVMMIPMILAQRRRAFHIAAIATIGSVLGALAGYWIGSQLMGTVGEPILALYGKEDKFLELSTRFAEYGIWAVLAAAVTPFPFKVITIFSGAVSLPLGAFIAVCVIGRALRFFIVAGLLWKFGAPIRDFIERRLGLVFTLFCVILIGGFLAVRFI